MIKKVGNKWVVYGKDGGKRLGTHDTKEKAAKQLRAIEMSKHMRAEINKLVKEVLESLVSHFDDLINSAAGLKSIHDSERLNQVQTVTVQ